MDDERQSGGGNRARSSYVTSLQLLQQRGFQIATVIDIGAAEGVFFVVRAEHRLFPEARHFFVDAMKENEEVYRKLATKYGAGYEIAALSCIEGEVMIRVDPNFYNTHVDHLQPGNVYTELRRVPMRTLDAVVEQHALQPPFAVKLDVQGGEMDVLRGGLRTLDDAVVVTAEVNIFSERDTLVELLALMQGLGWALFDITDLSYNRSDQSLYQCYATFFPKGMDFRKGTPWCLPEQEQEIYAGLRARRAQCVDIIEAMTRGG